MRAGILGAGQLGRMLALAGYPLGLKFRFFDPAPGSPAGEIAEQMVSSYEDQNALTRFAEGLDVITYEFENVPVDTVRFLEKFCPVYPPPAALEAAQDRIHEKSLFVRLGIPTPDFYKVDSLQDIHDGLEKLSYPAVLKTRRMGYDGKGQSVIRSTEDIESAWIEVGSAPSILEQFIPFKRELSLLSIRSRTGENRYYPLVENFHRDGILRLSLAPAPGVSAQLQKEAESCAAKLLIELNYTGLLAIEFFESKAESYPQLIANEMAPRVHNSGHWTQDGAVTSQFENHLRAVMGLPLGSTAPRGYAAMVNLIGEIPDVNKLLSMPAAKLHLYGKTARAGRKLGHINLSGNSREEFSEQLTTIQELLSEN